MHVLYVLGQNTGGLPHYTAELANAVTEHADVTVLKPTETTADDVFDRRIDVREAFAPLGVSLPRIARRDIDPRAVLRGVLSYRNLRRIYDVDPDVVHDTTDLFPQVKLFSKYYGIDANLPVVVTRHEVAKRRLSFGRPSALVEDVLDVAIPDLSVDRTVVHTQNQKRALIPRGVAADDVAVIPHGTYSIFGDYGDVDRDPEPNTLLFFGHVIPRKGIDTLVRAIPLVRRSVPDVKLVVAGDGRIPPEVSHVIDENPSHFELHDRFIPNEDVKLFFARAQAVVMPYRERAGGTTGHSGALATALSFGKPVVTSRAGDFPRMVERSGAGRTVPAGDPERLAKALTAVLQDDQARREMAENSRRLGEELSWDRIAERYVGLYRSVTGIRRPHQRV